MLKGGLPPPVRQHEIFHRGRRIARPDFAYPDAKLAIEADSYGFHSSAPDWRRDRKRQNRLTRIGWIVYNVTWEDATRHGKRVVADISALLERAATHIER